MIHTHRSHHAFTLIEVIAAMTVLFVGIIGICALFPASFQMAQVSKITTQATLIGQSKLDEMTALGFARTPIGTYTLTNQDLARFVPDAAERRKFRMSTVAVTAVPNTQNPLNNQYILKKITATVVYEFAPGRTKQDVFTTYLSNLRHG